MSDVIPPAATHDQPVSPPPLPEAAIPELLALLATTAKELNRYYDLGDDLDVERKADKSPVTEADLAAHTALTRGLAALAPGIPILSEESSVGDISGRRGWPVCWVVDPLDGTREFLGRTGEFTINVALVVDHSAVLGAIAVPLQNQCFLGIPGQGAWRCRGSGFAQAESLPRAAPVADVIRLLASKRHSETRVQALVTALSSSGLPVERVDAGSALKFCALLEGDGDIYPRTSPCYEWDVAAGDALVRAAGGVLLGEGAVPMRYNARDTLLVDYFAAASGPGAQWLPLVPGMECLSATSFHSDTLGPDREPAND